MAMLFNIETDFHSKADFDRFRTERPEFFGDECESAIVAHCRAHGAWNHFVGMASPKDVEIIGPEMREHFMVFGLNSRQRAVANQIAETYLEFGLTTQNVRIYGHEAITPLALLMRGNFPKYVGTEYARNEDEKNELWPIPHGDICQSDQPSGRYDIVMSCEVFEHVPDIDAALSESCRVLRSGGRFIGTFPFIVGQERSLRMAAIVNGSVRHLIEPPIYHDNPMDRTGGSLVFELPAWAVLDRAKRVGFSKARMRFLADQQRGIVSSGSDNDSRPRGVFLAVFDK